MPFYETTPWLIVTVVLLAVWITFTFAIASAARTFFAPRTRGRYQSGGRVLRTLVRR